MLKTFLYIIFTNIERSMFWMIEPISTIMSRAAEPPNLEIIEYSWILIDVCYVSSSKLENNYKRARFNEIPFRFKSTTLIFQL